LLSLHKFMGASVIRQVLDLQNCKINNL